MTVVQVISFGGMEAIADMILPMMNAIRMVWIISRYYGNDERMNDLFERIALEIGNRAEANIDVKVHQSNPHLPFLDKVTTLTRASSIVRTLTDGCAVNIVTPCLMLPAGAV